MENPETTTAQPAPSTEPTPKQEEKKSTGALVGSIIIIIILIIGGLYLWGERLVKEEQGDMTPEDILNEEDLTTDALGVQGESDELGDIEEDLLDTDLDNLDDELENIDLELDM